MVFFKKNNNFLKIKKDFGYSDTNLVCRNCGNRDHIYLDCPYKKNVK